MEENTLELIEEITEETTEEIIDSPPALNESEPVPEFTPDLEQTERSLEELLEDYIESRLVEDEENNLEGEEDTSISDSEIIVQDYSDYYSQIVNLLGENQLELKTQSTTLEDYNETNNIAADFETISLTNQLLILIYVSILFTALLNFSRRIF